MTTTRKVKVATRSCPINVPVVHVETAPRSAILDEMPVRLGHAGVDAEAFGSLGE